MKLKESENFANDWNPESSAWNLQSTAWNPESKTVLDHLTWGDCFSTSGGSKGRVHGVRSPHIRPDACLRLKFSHQEDRISLFNLLSFFHETRVVLATKLNSRDIQKM